MVDRRTLDFTHPLIMGILNVTPDSFSDAGVHASPVAAAKHGLAMAGQGAEIIDVGGESTRPGSQPVSEREQIDRVIPVIRELRAQLAPDVLISIDTRSALVAETALDAGASIVNDVSAGLADQRLLRVAADSGAYLVLMHMQGEPRTMQDDPVYGDVVEEVRRFLLQRVACAIDSGVGADRVVIDPGIGFGKRTEHNLLLLAALSEFVATGFPVLLGTSRKRFMGSLCGTVAPYALVPATVATTALGVMAGVRIFRVHDVVENRQAADVAAALRRSADDRSRL